MSTKPSSLEGAAQEFIDSAGDEMGAPEGIMGRRATPEQLDAFRDPKGNLPPNVFQLVRQGEGETRGPGRPKGSRNKRSDDLARLIAHKYGDPVEYMASLYAMPFDQLVELVKKADGGKASKTGDIAIKVLNIQLSAAKAVSEYVHSRKPVEHQVDLKNLPTFVMPGAGPQMVDFNQADQATRFMGDLIAKALTQGKIEPQDIVGLTFDGNQLAIEGHAVEVDPDDETEAGANG